MGFKKHIIQLANDGNLCITGLRGRGKDVLMSNIIARRKLDYISNVDYCIKGLTCHKLDLTLLDPHNTYRNFISGKLNRYEYPYADNIDVYISDAGIYFPSQYSSQLDKDYGGLSVYQAISRHLGDCNFHVNAQNLNRVWNKIREQSDNYVRCNWCKVFFHKIVIMSVTTYNKYESCVNNVEPYSHIKSPFGANKEVRAQYLARDEVLYRQYKNTYGDVKNRLLIFIHKANYDSRFIKKMLLEGSQL